MTPFRDNRKSRLAAGLVLLFTGLFFATSSAAAADGDTPGKPTRGTLMLEGQGIANSIPALRLGTDIDVTVTGTSQRVVVTQAFRNTSDHWLAGEYLYPLPDDGAVDSLKMVVGDRVIVGHIEQREQARKTFEQAAAAGRKAGLVEQQRPNLFTNRVANVGPGETVLVAIEYQAPVTQTDNSYSLHLPLVAGPRYVSPQSLKTRADVTDAVAVTAAPVMDPDVKQSINPVSITVHLDPGFTPAAIESPSHRIAVKGEGEQRTITLADNEVPADRDFVLQWQAASAEPSVGVFREHVDGQDYVMATLIPPRPEAAAAPPPRDMIFVIDNSGSMGGASMREAKASLLRALDTLRPVDRFNIIRFDDTLTQLFAHSVDATPEALATARRFTRGLAAAGGTEMLPALKKALGKPHAGRDDGADTIRQIVFLTDGAVSNEKQMLAAIGRDGGRSRLFPVAIGSAPNEYLMSRMAEVGRGSYTPIETPAQVESRMTALLEKLRHPVMRELSVTASDASIELTPAALPDLYAGQTLTLLGRSDRLKGTIKVRGFAGDRAWTKTIDLADAAPGQGIAKLWARRRIREIKTGQTLGRIDTQQADQQIAALGLRYSLVTEQTSLVAVDETPSRPDDAPLTREQLPINLPAGWDFDTLFGRRAERAERAAEQGRKPPQARRVAENRALDLPQTATDFAATLLWGLLWLTAGLLGLVGLRRSTRSTA